MPPVRPFKPLVVGFPRTGFTLLISVVNNLYYLTPGKWDVRQRALNSFIGQTSSYVSDAIEQAFTDRGLADGLVYNGNFRFLVGGPKWLHPDDTRACFRKYLGVRGMGDISLITAHPREVLDYYETIHSHSHPRRWLEDRGYADYIKMASVRNPVGTINSACFSINALTSEYIQKFIPPEQDNDELRQHLALFKLTNWDFFEGLIKPMKAFLAELLECRERFFLVMRWEDIITEPVKTILDIAKRLEVPLDEAQAQGIWKKLDHVNLTGAHKHNLRQGQGQVGGWKKTLTNDHLAVLREQGLGPICEELGFGKILDLNEADYTPFQKRIADHLKRGEVFNDYPDQDLFGFAFQKSNLDSAKFPFRRYGWHAHTQIERSCFTDVDVEQYVWERADTAVGRFNAAFTDLMAGDYSRPDAAIAHTEKVFAGYEDLFAGPKHRHTAMEELKQVLYLNAAPRNTFVRPKTTSAPVKAPQPNQAALQVLATPAPPAHRAPGLIQPRTLEFLDLESFQSVDDLASWAREGAGRILVAPVGPQATQVREHLAARGVKATFCVPEDAPGDVPPGLERAAPDQVDGAILLHRDGKTLAAELMRFLNAPKVRLIAPLTDWHFSRRPLFVISIPKAGTHLMLDLIRAFGYPPAEYYKDAAAPGHVYSLEYFNYHTRSRDFFVDSVRRNPFGNRHHPFVTAPALLMYRNPMDVVVSEANYYNRDGKTVFSGYLSNLPFAERLLRLIDDPWLLGSIRDRIGDFAAWLDFPNVVPVSFEELIGEAGGGSKQAQESVVWSLQLKLQVPGSPEAYAARVFNPESYTFREGQIGSYRKSFTPEAMKKFLELKQDFMTLFGYSADQEEPERGVLPKRVQEFRQRPISVSEVDQDSVPFQVDADFLGHNIVRFRKQYYAIAHSLGELDLSAVLKVNGSIFPSAPKLLDLKQSLLLGRRGSADEPASAPVSGQRARLMAAVTSHPPADPVGETEGFHLFRMDGKFLAVSRSVGEVTPLTELLGERELAPVLLVADSLDEILAKARETERRARVPKAELVGESSAFNILLIDGQYLALAKSLGPVDVMVEKLGEREMGDLVLKDEDVARLMSRIAAVEQARIRPSVEIVRESERYNILRVGDSFLALAKSLGPVDVMGEKLGERDIGELVMRSTDLNVLQERIGEIEYAEAERVMEMVATTRLYNLVRTGASYVAIAKELGPISVMVDRLGQREVSTLVLKEKSLASLQKRVEQIEQRGTRAEAAD